MAYRSYRWDEIPPRGCDKMFSPQVEAIALRRDLLFAYDAAHDRYSPAGVSKAVMGGMRHVDFLPSPHLLTNIERRILPRQVMTRFVTIGRNFTLSVGRFRAAAACSTHA